jgi:transposase
MQNTTIAVDLAKSVFEIAISHRPGVVAERKRLSRKQFASFLANHEPADVVMEACGTAHFWGRKAQEVGHTVRLLPPKYVRPYVRGNKTDRSDTKGILEADRNEDIVPVPVKSVEQQALTALHRMRSTWVGTRTSRINTLRGVLRELGLLIPVGARHVVPHVWLLLGDADSGVPDTMRPVLAEAVREITWLGERIQEVEKQLHGIAKSSPDIQRLLTIPGIGLLTATALVATLGNVHRFRSARHLASFLGLTPREKSSGYTRLLGRITKRGDPYLRTLLIHGGRSILHHAKRLEKPDRLRAWGLDRERMIGHNKAAIALANKLARIVWAVWKNETEYRSGPR